MGMEANPQEVTKKVDPFLQNVEQDPGKSRNPEILLLTLTQIDVFSQRLSFQCAKELRFQGWVIAELKKFVCADWLLYRSTAYWVEMRDQPWTVYES